MHNSGFVLKLGGTLLVCSVLLFGYLEAGCQDSEAAICCRGRNNTCKAKGATERDANSSVCFCDSACVDVGDCCSDYAVTCPAVDCILADDWSDWSECSVQCGVGVKQRTKQVVVEPENAGRQCPHAVEKVRCEGQKCKHQRTANDVRELKERGDIIPAQFATWRRSKTYDPFKDIRKNLFEHYVTPEKDTPPYSAKYQVTDVHSSCNSTLSTWSKRLERGTSVCVECQHFSMKKELGGRCRGHGVYQKTSEWKAVTVPGCHGKWIMTSRHRQRSSCDPNDDLSFVFV